MRTYSTDCKALVVSQFIMRTMPLLPSQANLTPLLWFTQLFRVMPLFCEGVMTPYFEFKHAPIGIDYILSLKLINLYLQTVL